MQNTGYDDERKWRLGNGLFELPAPARWRWEPEPPFAGSVRLPGGDRLACLVESYEDPEAIASGRHLVYLSEPDAPLPRAAATDPFDTVHRMIRTEGDKPGAVVWKIAGLLGVSHIRVARFELPLGASARPGDTGLERRWAEIEEALGAGRFASAETALDRIAPSPDQRQAALWKAIHLRLPEDWTLGRENEDGTGMYLAAPPDQSETLWIDYELYENQPVEAGLNEVRRETEALVDRMVAARADAVTVHSLDFIEDGGAFFTCALQERDGETPIRRLWLVRMIRQGERRLFANFHLCTPAAIADGPAQREHAAILHREIRNAVIVMPPAGD